MEAIEYRVPESRLLAWEFENPNVSAQLTAFLVTLLSFQITAVIYDVMFGIKPKNVARVQNLHMAFLTRRASPPAVLANLLRRDWMTRLYYGKNIPNCVSISRDTDRISSRTVIKFLLLLIIVPLVNIATVALSLRRQRKVSFADAGFRPIAIGSGGNFTSKPVLKYPDSCTHIPVQAAPGDSPLVKFSYCVMRYIWPLPEKEETISASIAIFMDTSLSLQCRFGDITKADHYTISLSSEEALYSLKLVDLDGVNQVFERAIAAMTAQCGISPDDGITFSEPHQQGPSLVLQNFTSICPNSSSPSELIDRVLQAAGEHVGIIETDKLEVSEYVSGADTFKPFQRWEGKDFLLRSRKNVSVFALLISCAVVLVLRIFLSFTLNSDVDIGLERIVKARLGVKCCHTMLGAEDRMVQYNNMYQMAGVAHYGLPRYDMPAVTVFGDGVVGGEFEEDSMENWIRQGVKISKHMVNEERQNSD